MDEIEKVSDIFDEKEPKSESINSQDDLENINLRSKTITDILVNYKEQQARRNEYKERAKKVFVPIFSIIAILFTIMMLVAVIMSFKYLSNEKLEFITAIISSLVTGFTAVISVILIIIKYVFPSDEETNFNKLISIIVENDTKRLEHISHPNNENNRKKQS